MHADVPTDGDQGPEAPRRAAGGRTGRPPAGMGSAMAWTVLGTVLPGLGLWRAGRRVVGAVVLAFAAVFVAGAAYAVQSRTFLVAFAADADVLRWSALALAGLAVAWVVVIGATYLALRPAGATTGQRIAGAAVVGTLSFAVAAPLALGAHAAYTAGTFVQTVFGGDDHGSETVPTIANTVDPWAEKHRLNVLILGGDSGTGRSASLGMRTDTVIVASIDTRSGATTLFSLPRQTARMPIPKDSRLARYLPYGWYDGRDVTNRDYWLNAMYRFGPDHVPANVLGRTRHLSEDIMKISVGAALGLEIDYFLTVNLDGAKDMLDALGKVTLNVNSPLPIGGDTDRQILPGGWIEPGPNQQLGGRLALWYARGRWGYDDYSRMARQRCLVNAVVQQASPQNILLNFEKLATAGEKTVSTDLPETMVAPVLELAQRVQGTKLRSVVFINGRNGFSTLNPNWALVRKQVKKALKETATSDVATASPSSTPKTSKTSTSDGLENECGYHPTGFIPKGYPRTRGNP